MTGFESFVGINPWTALFTFCNMLITFSVLKHFLFKPVKKMIDDRQQEIDTMYADADAAKQKAAALEKEYADHLQSIKDERDSMLREATARAQKRGQKTGPDPADGGCACDHGNEKQEGDAVAQIRSHGRAGGVGRCDARHGHREADDISSPGSLSRRGGREGGGGGEGLLHHIGRRAIGAGTASLADSPRQHHAKGRTMINAPIDRRQTGRVGTRLYEAVLHNGSPS